MKFAYARTGGPLLDWSGASPPSPTRAGETRSLGDYYPSQRTSSALRRYGGPVRYSGQAVPYDKNRALGALDVPRPGAPEIVSGYEAPQPGAATIHLGGHIPGAMSGYMPEGAIRNYGQTSLSADPPAKTFDSSLVRKGAVIAAAYHGVKRNGGSVLWGLAWAAAAYVAPLNGLLVPAVGVAQGFGKAK